MRDKLRVSSTIRSIIKSLEAAIILTLPPKSDKSRNLPIRNSKSMVQRTHTLHLCANHIHAMITKQYACNVWQRPQIIGSIIISPEAARNSSLAPAVLSKLGLFPSLQEQQSAKLLRFITELPHNEDQTRCPLIGGAGWRSPDTSLTPLSTRKRNWRNCGKLTGTKNCVSQPWKGTIPSSFWYTSRPSQEVGAHKAADRAHPTPTEE